LEQQAQLSATVTAVNLAYRTLWGIAALPSRLTSAAINWGALKATAKIVEAAATTGVGYIVTPQPNTPLKRLRDYLADLNRIVSSGNEINAELRRQTIASLDDFLSHQKTYLAESFNNGYRVGLDFAQENKFKVLSQALKDNTPIDGPFVNPLYDFIEKCWGYQQQFHGRQIGQRVAMQILGKPTSAIPATPGTSLRVKHPRMYDGLNPLPSSQVPPKDTVPSIIQEFDHLKSLGFKILLAFLILPESIIRKPDEENGGLLASLIKKSNTALDPQDLNNFQHLIFTELKNSDLNVFQKTWKKLMCWVLARPLYFIINHIVDQSKDVVLHLIGLSQGERLNLLVKILIEPGREFMGKLQSEYISVAQNPDNITTVEKAISAAIAKIRIKDENLKDLTPKDLIARLVSSLIDQYTPSLNWASIATNHFYQRAQQSPTPVFFIWFTGWSYLCWGVDIISTPGRWCFQKILRKVFKIVAVRTINSKLKDSSESSWDFGKLALDSLYKTLLNKLEKKRLRAQTDDTPTHSAAQQTVFVDRSIRTNISKLVLSFLKILYLQGSDLASLRQKLAPNDLGMQAIDKLAPGKIAAEQIIQGLQLFLGKEPFSASILEVLQNMREQCIPSGKPQEIRLEEEFYKHLQGAVKSGIQEALDERLDPSKRIQSEANFFVDNLPRGISDFQAEFNAAHTLTRPALDHLSKMRVTLLYDFVIQLLERAEDSTNPSAMVHINAMRDRFYDLRRPISEQITELDNLASNRRRVQELIEDLGQLRDPLDRATSGPEPILNATKFYAELQLMLQRVTNKIYPAPVQTVISALQRAFVDMKTEAAKMDNQTHLNGLILDLRQEVEQAIEANQQQAEGLSKRMAEEYQHTRHLVDNLADWAKSLKHFTCDVERSQHELYQQFLVQYAGKIEGGLSTVILGQLDTFFQFLGENHNVKGFLWYVLKAYLEVSRKEIEKIQGQVRPRPLPKS